jgi:uncharacterized damage-inducible protein DinB
MSIRRFYDRWPQYNRRFVAAIAELTADQLAIRHGPAEWPIWAFVGHTAAMRAYWLIGVCKEPRPAGLPFTDPEHDDWADDLEHPRTAAELVTAMTTTFAIVDGVLDRWTPAMLDETIERRYREVQHHTRASIIQRMITHEAWHAAQVSDALALHDLPDIDLWRPD